MAAPVAPDGIAATCTWPVPRLVRMFTAAVENASAAIATDGNANAGKIAMAAMRDLKRTGFPFRSLRLKFNPEADIALEYPCFLITKICRIVRRCEEAYLFCQTCGDAAADFQRCPIECRYNGIPSETDCLIGGKIVPEVRLPIRLQRSRRRLITALKPQANSSQPAHNAPHSKTAFTASRRSQSGKLRPEPWPEINPQGRTSLVHPNSS